MGENAVNSVSKEVAAPGMTADSWEGWEEERLRRGAVLEVVRRCAACSSDICLIVRIKG